MPARRWSATPWRAIDLGLPIHFRQALAEETKFPDNHFDIVYSYILFHEIPAEIARRVLAEMRRITRPGGHVAIVDFQSLGPATSATARYFFEFGLAQRRPTPPTSSPSISPE